jgi:hypothetical protein
MDMRLIDIEEWEDLADTIEEDGEDERGVF